MPTTHRCRPIKTDSGVLYYHSKEGGANLAHFATKAPGLVGTTDVESGTTELQRESDFSESLITTYCATNAPWNGTACVSNVGIADRNTYPSLRMPAWNAVVRRVRGFTPVRCHPDSS